jgi:hypothetical protein
MKSSQKSSHFSWLLFPPKSSQQEKKVASLATFRRIWSHWQCDQMIGKKIRQVFVKSSRKSSQKI